MRTSNETFRSSVYKNETVWTIKIECPCTCTNQDNVWVHNGSRWKVAHLCRTSAATTRFFPAHVDQLITSMARCRKKQRNIHMVRIFRVSLEERRIFSYISPPENWCSNINFALKWLEAYQQSYSQWKFIYHHKRGRQNHNFSQFNN